MGNGVGILKRRKRRIVLRAQALMSHQSRMDKQVRTDRVCFCLFCFSKYLHCKKKQRLSRSLCSIRFIYSLVESQGLGEGEHTTAEALTTSGEWIVRSMKPFSRLLIISVGTVRKTVQNRTTVLRWRFTALSRLSFSAWNCNGISREDLDLNFMFCIINS